MSSCKKDVPAEPLGDASLEPAVAVASASSSASATQAPQPTEPQQLLKFTFTSEVKNKEPADSLEAAASGQRVYAHLVLRNRSAVTRPVTLSFSVNGEKRTVIDLDVNPSFSYRTWAYNTLRKTDRDGELALEVKDDTGAILVDKHLPIKPSVVKKP